MTDREFEARLRGFYRTEVHEGETAPLSLRRDVAAIPRAVPQRERRFGRNRGVTLFAAAALLLVGGAIAAGSGLVRLPSLVPPQPAPSLAAVATASPAVESSSPINSPSPSPTATPVPVPPRTASWATTGSMIAKRTGFAALLLPDGKVLAIGGLNGTKALASAELYDSATGTWTATGSMVSHAGAGAGYAHFTATLLRDGKVLVAGGRSGNTLLTAAELYDPGAGTWTATGSMLTPRASHTATLLSDGRVLVAGGMSGNFLATAELYDPVTGTWTATGSMGTIRADHSATLLSDGRVLVAGGIFDPSPMSSSLLTSAELYDPGSGTWTYARSMVSPYDGGGPAALLPDGRVLLGGTPPQLYDPNTRSWIATGGKVIAWFHGPDVLLANGGVLALGAAKPGEDNPTRTAAYLFDPGAGSWTPAGKLAVHRYGYTATLLPDGKVLVSGGSDENAADANAALASAELFDPGTWSPGPIAPATPAPSPTPYAAQPDGSMFAYLQGGRLWVANRDGIGAHELLPDLIGNPGSPAWSPDGTHLAFSMTPDGAPDAVSRLYVTDSSGSAPQLVDTGCVAPCVRDTDAAFSRDGKRLVFIRTLMVPAASTEPVPHTGGKVAGDREASVIVTIDLATGQVTELASTTIIDCPLLPGQRQPGVPNCGGFADHNPRWSPDGTQIVFTQDVPYDINGLGNINGMGAQNWPPFSLFVVDADGAKLHPIGVGGYADWSPDGSRIVFGWSPRPVPILNPGKGTGYSVDPIVHISTVRPDGTDARQLTTDQLSAAPSWTADGRILFVRSVAPKNPDDPWEHQLWIMDADGGNATQVSVAPQVPMDQAYGRPSRP